MKLRAFIAVAFIVIFCVGWFTTDVVMRLLNTKSDMAVLLGVLATCAIVVFLPNTYLKIWHTFFNKRQDAPAESPKEEK